MGVVVDRPALGRLVPTQTDLLQSFWKLNYKRRRVQQKKRSSSCARDNVNPKSTRDLTNEISRKGDENKIDCYMNQRDPIRPKLDPGKSESEATTASRTVSKSGVSSLL